MTAALLGASLFASTDALADARTEARRHFRKGMEFITSSQYEQGIEELEKAYEILPHPNVLYNIARARVEVGDLEGAIVAYKRYLESGPKDKEDAVQVIAMLEARIKKRQAAVAAAGQRERPGGEKPGTTPEKPGGTPETPGVTPEKPSGTPETPGGTPEKPGGETTEKPGGETPEKPGTTPAEPGGRDLGQVKTEDVFEETVITASKGAQSPLDAPNSTSIITEQDIRLSGLTQIPELLRRLAGVDIFQGTAAQPELSLRGFNQRLSNKVVVLVNGRSVYLDLLGSTFWASLSIAVEDIERIEVVRGPGSALYGADAFNGVINIITKAPGEGKSGVKAGYGDHNAMHGAFWSTGRNGDFAWRFSAGYDYLSRWSKMYGDDRVDITRDPTNQEQSQRTTRMDLRMTRQFGNDVTVGLGGSFVTGPFEVLGVGPLTNPRLSEWTATDLTAYVNSKHIQARVFWNRWATHYSLGAQYLGESLRVADANVNIADGEVQYVNRFETGKGVEHDLHVGVDYRYKSVTWSWQDRERSENHYAGFIHDAIKLGDRFAVVGDYRADWIPYLEKVVQSPRGSLLFHPSKQSTVRGVLATAFRKPTFTESHVYFPVPVPYTGATVIAQGVHSNDAGYKVTQEKVFTAEVGYLNQESEYFVVDTAVFYNHVSDLIQLAPNRDVSVADVGTGLGGLDRITGMFPVAYGGFNNQCQAYDLYGGELGLRTFPVEGLDIYGNYTINSVKQDNSKCTSAELATIAEDSRTSLHKFNAGMQVRTKLGIDGSVDFHYVSPQTWSEQVSDVESQRILYKPFHLTAYSLVNARLGYRFARNQAEASAMVYNLLGTEHRQHPFGQLVGRRVMGFLSYNF